MTKTTNKETFENFKNSFSYGSRTDMNFKFLRSLPEEEAADFLQALLWKLGDAANDGDLAPLLELIYQGQIKAYTGPPRWEYKDAPFTPLKKPLAESTIAFITTSGHFVAGDDPQPFGVVEMSQEEATTRINDFLQAPPILSAIPHDTPPDQLRVRHGGYDIRAAQLDSNTVFPLDRLKELVADGKIGALAETTYSFCGATAQTPLQKESAPAWAGMMQQAQVDAVILVPV